MYASYPGDRRSALYGRGFSLYCMLEDVDAARDTAIADALDGRFQAVVFGDITRGWRTFNDLAPGLERAGVPMIVLDGSDFPAMYPYGPALALQVDLVRAAAPRACHVLQARGDALDVGPRNARRQGRLADLVLVSRRTASSRTRSRRRASRRRSSRRTSSTLKSRPACGSVHGLPLRQRG